MRRWFQATLAVVSAVMIVAGLSTVLGGATLVAGVDSASPEVDSEMRFYAVWYVIGGVLLLRSISTVERAGSTTRLIAAGFFVAGCARALSWIVVGRPHPIAITLMVLELVLPALIVPWQAVVEKRAVT